MSKFKAPFSKEPSGLSQTSLPELPPLKVGRGTILTPRTKKKARKRLRENIQQSVDVTRSVTLGSPALSLPFPFDSQSDTQTSTNTTEFDDHADGEQSGPNHEQSGFQDEQSEIPDNDPRTDDKQSGATANGEQSGAVDEQSGADGEESGEEFDLELSPREDLPVQKDMSHKKTNQAHNVDRNNNVVVHAETAKTGGNKTQGRDEEIKCHLSKPSLIPEFTGKSKRIKANIVDHVNNKSDQSQSLESTIESKMTGVKTQFEVNQDAGSLSSIQRDNIKHKSKARRNAKPMKPNFKKKAKSGTSVTKQIEVNQKNNRENEKKTTKPVNKKCTNKDGPKKIKQKNGQKKKNAKTSKKVERLELKSAKFEALNPAFKFKTKKGKVFKRSKTKQEIKDSVVKMIQKMHLEIVKLIDRREVLLKAQEKKEGLHSQTEIVAEE